ncbi:MAG: di-heme oxidoredictase family protein [Burkholderiales bacterium]
MNTKLLYALPVAGLVGFTLLHTQTVSSQTSRHSSSHARDPGVRDPDGPADAGGPIAGLKEGELAFFNAGLGEFVEAEDAGDGLGPTLNMSSCGGCHAQPAMGGSSPKTNPQASFAGRNSIPSFITPSGPVREVRFIRNADGTPDGGVHSLFTITGLPGADGCTLAQSDFERELARHNAIFRIPTPVFGAGLIEQIPDATILANQASGAPEKRQFGIRGRANFALSGRTISGQSNNNGNDGTIARFGWKAQNKSLLLFSAEAYNVEMGITSELFQTERDETPSCQFATVPNSVTDTTKANALDAISAIEKFAFFQRFLAPPTQSQDKPGGSQSINRGRSLFTSVGCTLCHTPMMQTGNSAVETLRNRPVNLYSDLLVHDMGPGLADGISQGQAGPQEFRTAPLWGLGKRIFFLHDGRTTDLLEAIGQHKSGGNRADGASEANQIVTNFGRLQESQKQDMLNFLRSL